MSSSDQNGERNYPFYGNVRPLLSEVLHAIDRLLDTGEPTTIDLAGLPFGPGELEHLEAMLGSGDIRETACPGVWWLEHRNAANDVVGRFIEITRTPEILSAQDADIAAGRARLEDKLD